MTPRVAVEADAASVLFAEDHHLREGERVGMRDRDERGAAADGREAAAGAAVELKPRRTAAADDLDVAPQHALRVAGAERLHRGLLGGEAAGKVDFGLAAPLAVRHFSLGEDTMDETIAVTFDGRGDARNVGRVDSQSDDLRHTFQMADVRLQIDMRLSDCTVHMAW